MDDGIIQLRDKQFKPYLPHDQIIDRVKEIARRINKDYEGKVPLFIAVLNGCFIFASDLFKELTVDCEISFVKLASYKGTSSTGNVISMIGLTQSLSDRHVIVLEDIIDTGTTMHHIIPQIEEQNPASYSICSLILKPDSLQYPIDIKYTGIEIPNDFIVGYGLDYDGYGRNLKDIYQVID